MKYLLIIQAVNTREERSIISPADYGALEIPAALAAEWADLTEEVLRDGFLAKEGMQTLHTLYLEPEIQPFIYVRSLLDTEEFFDDYMGQPSSTEIKYNGMVLKPLFRSGEQVTQAQKIEDLVDETRLEITPRGLRIVINTCHEEFMTPDLTPAILRQLFCGSDNEVVTPEL